MGLDDRHSGESLAQKQRREEDELRAMPSGTQQGQTSMLLGAIRRDLSDLKNCIATFLQTSKQTDKKLEDVQKLLAEVRELLVRRSGNGEPAPAAQTEQTEPQPKDLAKEIAADAANRFDLYVERILTQRLSNAQKQIDALHESAERTVAKLEAQDGRKPRRKRFGSGEKKTDDRKNQIF